MNLAAGFNPRNAKIAANDLNPQPPHSPSGEAMLHRMSLEFFAAMPPVLSLSRRSGGVAAGICGGGKSPQAKLELIISANVERSSGVV